MNDGFDLLNRGFEVFVEVEERTRTKDERGGGESGVLKAVAFGDGGVDLAG